ncbi:MAG: type IV pilin [Nitrospiraceae bacterium]|nr:MAG: type IV pilin [Nitrospiraceae bacterium]
MVRAQQGFTLIELMIVVAVLGIVSAIAIPNYLRYQGKSRQSEAKTNLGGVFVAEATYYGEQSRYSSFDDIGFTVAASTNRYTYRSQQTTVNGGVVSPGVVVVINPGNGAITPTPDNTVVAAASGGTGFTATATADLDSDLTIDQWHVNDLKQNLQVPDTDDVLG